MLYLKLFSTKIEIENIQPVPSRKNLQPVLSLGKHAILAKRGKTCNRYQARENVGPLPSAGKHASGARCERENGTLCFDFFPDFSGFFLFFFLTKTNTNFVALTGLSTLYDF